MPTPANPAKYNCVMVFCGRTAAGDEFMPEVKVSRHCFSLIGLRPLENQHGSMFFISTVVI